MYLEGYFCSSVLPQNQLCYKNLQRFLQTVKSPDTICNGISKQLSDKLQKLQKAPQEICNKINLRHCSKFRLVTCGCSGWTVTNFKSHKLKVYPQQVTTSGITKQIFSSKATHWMNFPKINSFLHTYWLYLVCSRPSFWYS